MILVEGYTDVLALHQAGLRNAVGIMGTSLTKEQVDELERVVRVLELCLDADRAGQDAMLRASRAGRRAQPRAARGGAARGHRPGRPGRARGRRGAAGPGRGLGAVRGLRGRADPRRRRHRQRARGASGRCRSSRPMLQGLPGSVLRDDLMRRVSGRLELTEGQLRGRLSAVSAAPAPRAPGRQRPRSGGPPRPRRDCRRRPAAEREFLSLCIALPDLGEQVLGQIDDRSAADRRVDAPGRAPPGRAHAHAAGRPARRRRGVRPRRSAAWSSSPAGCPTPAASASSTPAWCSSATGSTAPSSAPAARASGTNELARERETVRDAIRAVVARLEKTL